MMSQRFSLFYAGFTAYAPALYFNQLELVDLFKAEDNESITNYLSKFSEGLQDKVYESNTHIQTAISVAKHLELEILPEPLTYEEYYNWITHYTECFEKEFPMGRIDHYYFLFARKIAEIFCNLGLLKTYIDLCVTTEGSADLSKKMEKCLKDTEFILFKLMAAAALLSSEPRQNYFNVFYRSLCQEFQLIKDFDVTEAGKEKLLKFHSSINEYDLIVMDGFKKCIGMLKDLGI